MVDRFADDGLGTYAVNRNVFTRPQEWSWRFEGDFVGILPSWMMSGQDR
jgi:hypothetical protein